MDKKIDPKKHRKAISFINATIGISDKLQTAMFAATIGLGGQDLIRKKITDLNKLCKEWRMKKD